MNLLTKGQLAIGSKDCKMFDVKLTNVFLKPLSGNFLNLTDFAIYTNVSSQLNQLRNIHFEGYKPVFPKKYSFKLGWGFCTKKMLSYAPVVAPMVVPFVVARYGVCGMFTKESLDWNMVQSALEMSKLCSE